MIARILSSYNGVTGKNQLNIAERADSKFSIVYTDDSFGAAEIVSMYPERDRIERY